MASPPSTGSEKGSSRREGTTKAMVAEQISQSVQSTSNLLHIMQQTSRAQSELMKLPKNLLAKASAIKNTGQILEQMPSVISSLDAYTENGLQRFIGISKEPKTATPYGLGIGVFDKVGQEIEKDGSFLLVRTYQEIIDEKICVPHLKTVIQLLENIESCQLSYLSQEEHPPNPLPGAGSQT